MKEIDRWMIVEVDGTARTVMYDDYGYTRLFDSYKEARAYLSDYFPFMEAEVVAYVEELNLFS